MLRPRNPGGVITFMKYDQGPIGISIGPGGVILRIHDGKRFHFENSRLPPFQQARVGDLVRMVNGEEDYQWQHGTLVQDAWFFQLTWLRGPYDDNRVLLVRKPAGNQWGVAVNEHGRIADIFEGGHFDNARKFRIDEGQPKPGDVILSVNTIPGHTVLAATRYVTFTARIVWRSQADYARAVPKAPPSGLYIPTKFGKSGDAGEHEKNRCL
jgi:hypothetical protein